jgi:hypothetical protein
MTDPTPADIIGRSNLLLLDPDEADEQTREIAELLYFAMHHRVDALV